MIVVWRSLRLGLDMDNSEPQPRRMGCGLFWKGGQRFMLRCCSGNLNLMGTKKPPSTSVRRTFVLTLSSCMIGALLSTGYWYGTIQERRCPPPSLPFTFREDHAANSIAEQGQVDTLFSGDGRKWSTQIGGSELRGSMPLNITCRISTAILSKHIPPVYIPSDNDKNQQLRLRIPQAIYQTMESAVMPLRMAQVISIVVKCGDQLLRSSRDGHLSIHHGSIHSLMLMIDGASSCLSRTRRKGQRANFSTESVVVSTVLQDDRKNGPTSRNLPAYVNLRQTQVPLERARRGLSSGS